MVVSPLFKAYYGGTQNKKNIALSARTSQASAATPSLTVNVFCAFRYSFFPHLYFYPSVSEFLPRQFNAEELLDQQQG